MCTVTYIPNNNGFFLSSNRDEKITRASTVPKEYIVGGKLLFFPMDSVAKGTWIATDKLGNVSCLLNGAFVKHKNDIAFTKSRGQIVLDSFLFENFQDFLSQISLNNVAPFTLLVIKLINGVVEFNELRWDGNTKHVKNIDTDKAQIWSSVTLYSDEMIANKQKRFEQFLQINPTAKALDVFNFHQSKEDINNGGMLLQNNTLRTVSVSQLNFNGIQMDFNYQDLLINEITQFTIPIDTILP